MRLTLMTLLLLLWLTSPALATCTNQTIFVNGQMKICQTCCQSGQCTTFCL